MKLYHAPESPYCEKVRFALDHLGLEWEEELVSPEDPSAVRAASDQDEVPVLDDEGKIVVGSRAILAHLAEIHDSTLLSTEMRPQGLASILEAWADDVFGPTVDRFVVEPSDATARDQVDAMFEQLEQTLFDQTYLVGDMLTYADVALYAFMSRIDGETRMELTNPYPQLRDWYLNLEDYRQKAKAAGFGEGLLGQF